VVSSVPDRSVNLVLLDALKGQEYRGKPPSPPALPKTLEALEKAGADVVFRPYADADDRAAEVLTDSG
jgi:hypothetical protein